MLDIHGLIGSATPSELDVASGSSVSLSLSPASAAGQHESSFPEAGQTIGGFYLVEELGRGAFARVFLARERQLADRPVALKVTRKGSREPQALARLQHTHIVPVHSHRVDPATGLHLLCMPYFGRITLARVLTEIRQEERALSGAALVETLNRLSETGRSWFGGPIDLPVRPGQSQLRPGDRLVDRTPGRGSGTRPRPGCAAPRHQAQQRAAQRRRHADALGLQPGAGAGARRATSERKLRKRTLGGTVDYMSPEHLDALAEGISDRLDGRVRHLRAWASCCSRRSWARSRLPPRKGQSVIDSLLRAAEERSRDPAKLFAGELAIPAPLGRSSAAAWSPSPTTATRPRASSPPISAQSPMICPGVMLASRCVSRISRRLRRNRRRLASTVGGPPRRRRDPGRLCQLPDRTARSVQRGERPLSTARGHRRRRVRGSPDLARQRGPGPTAPSSAVSQLAEAGYLLGLRRQAAAQVEKLWTSRALTSSKTRSDQGLDGQELVIGATSRRVAGTSESLRFRLIGLGEDIPGAVGELKSLLEPFYVLTSKEDWNKLDYIWGLLDDRQRATSP